MMGFKKNLAAHERLKSEINRLQNELGIKVIRLTDYDGNEEYCGERLCIKIGENYFDEIHEYFKIDE